MGIARGASRRNLIAAWLGLSFALLAPPAGATPPRLLLRADFDGEPSCLSKQVGSQPGVGGHGSALLLAAGARCEFPAAGHLDRSAGTVSFWVQPHDWNDGEGGYQTFFAWSGVADGRPFELYVDTSGASKVVRLVVAYGVAQDPHQELFQISAPATWRIGLWQKIDVTWTEHEIVLYANGRTGERLPLETVRLPDPAGMRLQLTPPRGFGRPQEATTIDGLEIWDAALPPDRIAKRFEAESAPPLAPPTLRAPRASAPPAIDGSLDDAVWQKATRVPLLADAETGFTGLAIPHASFAWSPGALHLAFEAPLTDPADAFDLTLARAGGVAKGFRVTTRGIGGEDAVSEARVQVAARVEGDVWRAELSVPFAALGGAIDANSVLRVDVRQQPGTPGLLGVGARLAGADLTLGGEGEGVRIDAGPELALGRIALAFARDAGASVEVELARTSGRPWHERLALRGRSELRETPDPPDGVLHISVRDDSDREWVRLESRLAALDVPGLVVVPEPDADRLGVELELGWLDGSWLGALAAGRAQARLLDRGPKGVESHDLALDAAGRAHVSFVSGLAPGPHTLALELKGARGTLALEHGVEVPKLPWLKEKLGETAGVLDPWLPLGWDDDASVRVWGRRYRFDGPLLASVSNDHGPLLRAPMQLRLRTAKGEVPLRVTAAKVTGRSAARADFAGTGSFDGAGVDVGWTAWVEYDGVVVSSFTLTPKAAGTRVEQLVLDMPLDPRIVKYLRGMQQGSTIRRGRTAWDGHRFATAFEPFVWLSSESEGFLYFAESAANWVGAERSDAVVVRGGGDAGITLRLIGEPVTLPGPVTYTLGFEATPVKPELPKARSWNFGSAGEPTPNETVIAWYDGYAVTDGVWELSRPMAVAEYDLELTRRGARPFYYATVSATPDNLPAFRLFEPLWRSAWSFSYGGQPERDNRMRGDVPEHRLAAVCPADATFQAKMLHDAKALLGNGVVGLYTDTDEVFSDDNSRHGCGYLDAFGRRGVTWTILSKRSFGKRLAALLREAGGARRYWLAHAHTRLVPPVQGFADFWFPGEELANPLGRNRWLYSDGLDDDAWRVEYRGASSGITHIFLPEFWRGSGDKKDLETRQPTESMVAMAAVNDVNVSSAYTSPEVTGEYWGLRKKLGLIDAEFVGHWQSDCPVHALASDARASVYRTAKGPVLVVASRAPTAKQVEVELDLPALGVNGPVRARDARSGQALVLNGDRLTVPLEPRSYTYVTLH